MEFNTRLREKKTEIVNAILQQPVGGSLNDQMFR